MIRVYRGDEPLTLLGAVRDRELSALRALIEREKRPPGPNEIHGYKVVKDVLWEAQGKKCCYCESREQRDHRDVEHHRPKGRADRSPGCVEDHGYWWLAFTWDNLLLSCNSCNRSYKRIKFPLDVGSAPLIAEEGPPGREVPLLIDPAKESGVPHIQFRRERRMGSEVWIPRARRGSRRGAMTIEVCGLDRDELLTLYGDHVKDWVEDEVGKIKKAIAYGDREAVKVAWVSAKERLLSPRQPYVALAYDALELLLPSQTLWPYGCSWPVPD